MTMNGYVIHTRVFFQTEVQSNTIPYNLVMNTM